MGEHAGVRAATGRSRKGQLPKSSAAQLPVGNRDLLGTPGPAHTGRSAPSAGIHASTLSSGPVQAKKGEERQKKKMIAAYDQADISQQVEMLKNMDRIYQGQGNDMDPVQAAVFAELKQRIANQDEETRAPFFEEVAAQHASSGRALMATLESARTGYRESNPDSSDDEANNYAEFQALSSDSAADFGSYQSLIKRIADVTRNGKPMQQYNGMTRQTVLARRQYRSEHPDAAPDDFSEVEDKDLRRKMRDLTAVTKANAFVESRNGALSNQEIDANQQTRNRHLARTWHWPGSKRRRQ